MPNEIITGLISTAFGGLITYLVMRRKVNSDIASQMTDTALGLIDPLKQRIIDLEGEVDKLKRQVGRYLKRVVYLMDGIAKLIAQIKELKQDPCWHPEDWFPDDC